MNQCLKAFHEAESYHGPSIIIAYAPCINHGINMAHAQMEIKRAVACGYWPLYRYNPELAEQGKNPLIVDSKDPTESYQDFIRGEVRYASLAKLFPAKAEEAYKINEEDAKRRLEMSEKKKYEKSAPNAKGAAKQNGSKKKAASAATTTAGSRTTKTHSGRADPTSYLLYI